VSHAATITPAPIRKTLTVRATPEKAFRVFTEGFDRWWPKSHTIGKAALKEAVLEPKPGGRWYGIDVEGGEQDWGEVLEWEPPRRLLLAWRISGQWAYDPKVGTEVEVVFTDLGEGQVRVDFEHRHLERLGEGAVEAATAMGGGWATILELYKTVAES
jgi:uncharacterized protein YndB with AHSA1/START domain